MSEEINSKLEEMGRVWSEYKSTAEKAKQDSDALVESKLSALDTTLANLQSDLDELNKKSGRLEASEEGEAGDYEAKFNDWARTGENERELKSMATVGAVDGEVVVPTTLDLNIVKALREVSAMRNLATVVSTSSEDFSFLRSDSATASNWVGEEDERPETDTPSIVKVAVPFGEQYANPGVTQKALDDGAFDVAGFLATEIANTFAATEGAAFISGNGTNKPKGILATGTGIAQVDALGADLDADDIINLVYSLASQHRAGAAFIGSNNTMAAVRKLQDANGNYLWQPSMVAGQPATLAGYAAYEDGNMPDIGAGALPLAFGDYKKGYLIADRMGITMMRDPYTNKPYVHFYATKRVGGQVRDASAIKLLKFA